MFKVQMPELSRYIPVIALTIVLSISLVYLYRSLNVVSERLDHFSQEFYYGMNSVNEIAARIQHPAAPPADGGFGGISGNAVEACIDGNDDIQSAASEDVVVTKPPQKEADTATRRSPKKVDAAFAKKTRATPPEHKDADEVVVTDAAAKTQDSDPIAANDVDAYIENLQDKFVDSAAQKPLPDDDAVSIDSEISSVNQMNGRKKVPPYSSRNFEIGHTEIWNGQKFPVIVTKSGTKRWGAAQPLDAE